MTNKMDSVKDISRIAETQIKLARNFELNKNYRSLHTNTNIDIICTI